MADLNISTDSPDFLTDDSLHEAYELEIKSVKGQDVRFGEIVASKGDSVTSIVIFSEFCVFGMIKPAAQKQVLIDAF